MEERWEVIAGRVGFRIDGVERTLGRGETIVAPPGSSHTSWNVGGGPNAEGELDPKALVALLAEFGREIAT